MENANKRQLGQFFTKNSDYILNNLDRFIRGKSITDPFAGDGDLIQWSKKNGAKEVIGYDIDERYINHKTIYKNDSILEPKEYKFILTNPPYLNINKANDQIKGDYFCKFNFEDLYQISLASIMKSEEGIVIVPINFLSAENSKGIRNLFFSKFKIIELNYFKEKVFSDTTNNVVAFYYKKLAYPEDKFSFKINIYPENKASEIKLEKKYGWKIAGDFLNKIEDVKNILKIRRLTESDIKPGKIKAIAAYNHIENIIPIKISEDLQKIIDSNIIFLKAIDTGSKDGKIALENIKQYGVDCLISKESSRHMIYLVFENEISIKDQEKIILRFNQKLNQLRDDYLSLFLTNFRDNDRKRISFDFVYKFINYIYINEINKNLRPNTLNI